MTSLPYFFKMPQSLAKLPKDTPVLLALSGGSDSVSLLHLLCRLRQESYFPLYAAHVNHNIRTEVYGNEALRDEQFCRKICEERNVPLFVFTVDLPQLASERGDSLETAARQVRYAFFADLMREHRIPILVTAHNANDNLETQLFNLCRGSGLPGICGIPEMRDFPEGNGTVVRPLLGATKAAILDYCLAEQLDYMTDSTNLETDCTRNALRHNVIPALQSLFATPEEASLRLSSAAKEALDFLTIEAKRFLKSQSKMLSAKALRELHPALLKRVLQLQFAEYAAASLSETHLQNLASLIQKGKNGSLSLPGCLQVNLEQDRVTFEPNPRGQQPQLDYRIPLQKGLTLIADGSFAIFLSKEESLPAIDGSYRLYASAILKINDPASLTARNRREGDLIFDNGMHKKVKKILCDRKIPKAERDLLPMICSGDEILYIPGVALSDSARPSANEPTHPLMLTVYIKKTNLLPHLESF